MLSTMPSKAFLRLGRNLDFDRTQSSIVQIFPLLISALVYLDCCGVERMHLNPLSAP